MLAQAHENQAPETLHTDAASLQWQTWSVDAVNQATHQRKPAFVDFTAAWCITCKVNEKTTLGDTQIVQAFKQHEVLMFKADWTHQNPEIAQTLKSLGRAGVPVYLLIDPKGKTTVFSEVLSKDDLLSAMERL
jgi:thiol:disulfide interchange protein DsbD